MKPIDFHLDRYVPYLLNLAGGRIALETAHELKAARVKYRMWRVVLTLWHHGPLHLVEVSKLANFELSAFPRSHLPGKEEVHPKTS